MQEPTRQYNDLPLYGATFLVSVSLTTWWLAMPFLLAALGGTAWHVGLAPAMNMAAYAAVLLLATLRMPHLDCRKTTRRSLWVIVVCAVATELALLGPRSPGPHTGRIWLMIASGTVAGMAAAFLWPYLMTWCSAGYEGKVLNKRLGYYNRAWSSGMILGPLVGGSLVGMHLRWPILAVACGLGVCGVLLGLARSRATRTLPASPYPQPQTSDAAQPDRTFGPLRWMARVALFATWAGLAILRSQFALLSKARGFSESQYGLVLTLSAVSTFVALTIAGKSPTWHGRTLPLMATTLAAVVSMLILVFGKTLALAFGAAALLGGAIGLAYAAHLYYGAAGRTNHATPMTLHEITVALSMIIASGLGGFLPRYGVYGPYWMIVIFASIALLIQIGVWTFIRHNKAKSP